MQSILGRIAVLIQPSFWTPLNCVIEHSLCPLHVHRLGADLPPWGYGVSMHTECSFSLGGKALHAERDRRMKAQRFFDDSVQKGHLLQLICW
jgi:hypothetical protein